MQKEKLQIVSIFRFGHKKRGLFQCPPKGREFILAVFEEVVVHTFPLGKVGMGPSFGLFSFPVGKVRMGLVWCSFLLGEGWDGALDGALDGASMPMLWCRCR